MHTEDVIQLAAATAHEINRQYCLALGDDSHQDWIQAPAWQTESVLAGVRNILVNPEVGPEQSHEAWYARKRAEGWTYGEHKDPHQKTHPCFLPYEQLPYTQRMKDQIFTRVVKGILRHHGLIENH